MSSLSSEFSKVASFFEILIWLWHFSRTSTSFSLIRLYLSLSNSVLFVGWLTDSISLTLATTRSVSHSASLEYWAWRAFEIHPLSVKMWTVWLRSFHQEWSKCIDECFSVGILCCVKEVFRCGRVYRPISITLNIFTYILVSSCHFGNTELWIYISWENFRVVVLNWSNTWSSSSRTVFSESPHLSSVGE